MNDQRGYTLLFAVLTAALVLGVAVFIVSVSTRQYQLASSVRNSMYSFYAADSGVECAAAAYNNGLINASSSVSLPCNGTNPTAAFNQVSSATNDVPLPLLNSTYALNKAIFNISMPGNTCAVIYVFDGYNTSGSPYVAGTHYTIIDSRGYNRCTSTFGPDTSYPDTVERALRLTKQG